MSVRVLLVEDLRAAHDLVAELLEIVGGFRIVGHCQTEGAALQWLHDHPEGADLVILDLMLREGSGFTILAELERRTAPDVVVFSDFASPAVVGKCRSLGAKAAIAKSDYLRLRTFLDRYRGQLAESA